MYLKDILLEMSSGLRKNNYFFSILNWDLFSFFDDFFFFSFFTPFFTA